MMVDAPSYTSKKEAGNKKEAEGKPATVENVAALMRKSGLKLDGTPL